VGIVPSIDYYMEKKKKRPGRGHDMSALCVCVYMCTWYNMVNKRPAEADVSLSGEREMNVPVWKK
jgi:hypothetical protein